MVFLPKRMGLYWGIGLVEVVYKVCVSVVNFWLKRSVTLHDSLHGFRSGMGTGTDTLEEKLAQKLVGIAHEPLLQVFLDVQKAYDYLYRGRCMDIMRGYGMGQNMARLIAHYWDNLLFVPKASRFLWMAFSTGIGVAQGDTASLMIFNRVVDVVV